MATEVCINNDGIVIVFCPLLHTHPFHIPPTASTTLVVIYNLGPPYMMHLPPLVSFPYKKGSVAEYAHEIQLYPFSKICTETNHLNNIFYL